MEAHFQTQPVDVYFSPVPNSTDWIVRKPITYYSKLLDRWFIIPQNFITDLASTPSWIWWLYPPSDIYDLAVGLHDWLYWTQETTRAEADDVLREAMLVCGCKQGAANNFHFGVNIGGGAIWKKYSQITDKTLGFCTIVNGQFVIPEIPELKKAA
jgi:hypothetical protein